MPVSGINKSDGARIEQVRTEQSAEDTRLEERRRQDDDEGEAQVLRRAAEEGRGGSVDITA